ncbi:MAG: hypothetical protein Q8Q39_05260 [bacterium]|nr:hypothetical protein [bacterium]
MENEFSVEKLIEQSTRTALQSLADNEPAEFLKLWRKSKDPGFALDEETKARFKRFGFVDDTGAIHESALKVLRSINPMKEANTER